MVVLSGEPIHYSNLKLFGVLEFADIKQDKLDVKVVKCIFMIILKAWMLTSCRRWVLENKNLS